MTVSFENEEFRDIRILGSNRTYQSTRIAGCKFSACHLAQFDDPEFNLVIKDAAIENCGFDRCSIQGVMFDNVVIEGMRFKQLHRVYGCVFRNVRFLGKVGPVIVMGPHASLARREKMADGIIRKYREIDWAVDISEAIFSDADFHYVPGHLIRRDPETQILLHREKFVDIPASDFPPYARIWVSRFEVSPFDSLVAVAPKASRKFADYMRDLVWMRENDLAE
ncbi:hypothetical protein WDV06_09265 [Streptomyces racemochromogenes]|uniref:Pentapeptide repeat-containing protein n=1 Tax=Streptomyces racemochromogenes TaxID=67353 RepID=A0ABW7PAA4_9ACTN